MDLLAPTTVVADASRLPDLGPAVRAVDIRELEEIEPAEAPVRPSAAEDDAAVIVFTAGTTGAPKGVTLPHRAIIANLHNLLAGAERLPQHLDPARPPVVNLQSGPLFHIGGLQSTMLSLLGGSTVILTAARFDAGSVLHLVEHERVTVWGAVPTMASRVVEHPDVERRDLSSVRSITMGGAPVPPRLLERLRECFPNAHRGLSTIYGLTETGGTVASASGALMAQHPTTAGPPGRVVDLRIEAPDVNGEGEILVRTPGQMLGYWGEDAADLIDSEGFVHTGDRGRLTDGLLFATGRVKDLIIRGGENVAPAHVEAALLTHPQVRNVAVLGLPDPDLGEIVAAAVEVRPGAPVTATDLSAHVAARVARFAVPTRWWIRVDPLPVTDAGKTHKRALAAAWPDTG